MTAERPNAVPCPVCGREVAGVLLGGHLARHDRDDPPQPEETTRS